MTRAAFAALLFASTLDAQVVSTRCATSVVAVPYDPNGARLLVTCDHSFPDDVLWNLDRASLGVLIDGHGTAVASSAAGNRVGVAPGAALVSIRAFGFVALTPARLTEALDAVIRHAWDPAAPPFEMGIVTMSIGLFAIDAGVETKIREMIGGVDRDGCPAGRQAVLLANATTPATWSFFPAIAARASAAR